MMYDKVDDLMDECKEVASSIRIIADLLRNFETAEAMCDTDELADAISGCANHLGRICQDLAEVRSQFPAP